MKVALVYDRINKWGGAERVLLALHKLFPEAPIFTSVYSKKGAPWADGIQIIPSFLQKIPFFRNHHEILAPLMPIAFESFDFSEYDVVISVTSEAAKGVITSSHTLHICMCLTPTRYLWSGYTAYFGTIFSRLFSSPLIAYLKKWDVIAAQRPDFLIAISENVQSRIERYYFRRSEVIYPPLTLVQREKSEILNFKFETNSNDQSPKNKKNEDYFLVVSRLSKFTMYKRVDLAIKAANRLKIPLKIVGEGRDLDYFKEMAGETIEFLGQVSDEELSHLYADANALIFPGEEDFGLVMVEAQAQGTPVIAYRSGGAVEIVVEGKTGVFFDKQTVKSLVDAIEEFGHKRIRPETCIQNAKRFSEAQFEKQIRWFVKRANKDFFAK
jgi:glycosyltransferase involved in cell wall biosynthesis